MTDFDIAAVLRDRAQRDELLLTWYKSNPAAVRGALLAEYRCRARGCLLARFWRMREVVGYYQPAYKLSRAKNEAETVPEARAKRTTDGDRHWAEAAHVLDDLRGWGSQAALHMQCDHFREAVKAVDLLAQVDAATPGKPVRVSLPSV
ncbi:hypothetical protein ABKW28_10695 [Nocardioides sp. 31GB23]|uniref:hypothetical protein n=1 Tax=Nocardioides sp. 31GB23 TaxID=3156065 RepID=UPI0032AF117A